VQREFEASAPAFANEPPAPPHYDPIGGDGLRWRMTSHDHDASLATGAKTGANAAMGGALRTNVLPGETPLRDGAIERPTKTIPRTAMVAAALLAAASVLALGVVIGRSGTDASPAASGSVAVSPTDSPVRTPYPTSQTSASVPSSTSGTPPAPLIPTTGCVIGERHLIVPYASPASGLEASFSKVGVALGFALAPKEGMGVVIDKNFAATAIERAHAPDRLARITAWPTEKSVALALETDRTRPKSSPKRSATDLTATFAVEGGHFVHQRGDDPAVRFFRVDSDGVEGLRAIPSGPNAYAFSFKRGSEVFFGEASVAGKNGPTYRLRRVDTKRVVAPPSLALSGHTIAVAWAERGADDDVWTVSLARLDPDDGAARTPSPVVGFAIPRGGAGERAFTPSLAGYADGFALAWAEGPLRSAQIRAQRLSRTFSARGDAIVVSAPGRHALEPRVALDREHGDGVIAFFVETDSHYALWGAAMACGRDSAGE